MKQIRAASYVLIFISTSYEFQRIIFIIMATMGANQKGIILSYTLSVLHSLPTNKKLELEPLRK